MKGRAFYRGIIPPVLFLVLVALSGPNSSPTARSASTPAPTTSLAVYATLGPEAPSILHVLIGDKGFVTVQPGQLADALKLHTVSTLIASKEWADEGDLSLARSAGLRIVTVERHDSVAHIEANIRALAALTGTDSAGARWVASIDAGLAAIQAQIPQTRPLPRVLVLSPESYTHGQGALITELITLAGGINVAAEAGIPEAREVEDDQIRQFAPDVVLLIRWTPAGELAFARNPVYRGLPAFDRFRLYRILTPGRDPAHLVDDVQRLAILINRWQF